MRRNALRALGLGTALAVLTALLCLAVAAGLDSRAGAPLASIFDAPTLTLAGLAKSSRAESVLMSCAEDSAPAGGGSMLWCSDPSSPHCIPAQPDVPRPEVWDRPDSYLLSSFEVPSDTFVLLAAVWPRPLAASLYARNTASRLERPPRA